MIVYLARAIQAFVMYCVNGTSRSSLLIESIDSMIESTDSMIKERDWQRTMVVPDAERYLERERAGRRKGHHC